MTDPVAFFRQHGYSPLLRNRVCVDFDGVLFPKVGIWDTPDPFPGAVDALVRLRGAGLHITIWTSRLDPDWLREEGLPPNDMYGHVASQLDRHGIPYDRILGKPSASAYVDDLAIRFQEGEWPAVTDWLLWSRSDCE